MLIEHLKQSCHQIFIQNPLVWASYKILHILRWQVNEKIMLVEDINEHFEKHLSLVLILLLDQIFNHDLGDLIARDAHNV